MVGEEIGGGLQPVDRLPAELLSQVFERATWIRLTWVCRHWRLVAIGSPELWVLIIVDNCPWKSLVPAFLERSRKIPLAVSIKHARKDAEAILGLCLPHAHRLRQLALEGPIGPLLAPLLGSLNALEEAHLTQKSADASKASSFGPVQFFPDDFPQLRILNLSSVDVTWENFSVPSLHELVLDLTWLQFTSLSATSVLRIMGDSPGLRSLKLPSLTTRLPSSPEDTHGITDVMSLAHLEEIELAGTWRDISYVLDHFTVPSDDCAIRIEYDVWADGVTPIEMVIPGQLAFRSLLSHCTTVELDVVILATVSVVNESGTCFISLTSPDQLGASYPTITEAIWMAIPDTFSISPLSHFSIRYHSHSRITAGMWTALFGRFPLEYVETTFCGSMEERGRGNLLENLFDALRGSASFRVTTLKFAFLTLTRATTKAILDLLEYRARAGRALESLIFVLCFCDSTIDVQDLKAGLESYVNVDIRYDIDAGAPAEFRIYDNQPGSFSSEWSMT